MLNCPHCDSTIDMKSLRHQSLFRNFRVCPSCAGQFTVDRATKRRQAIALGLSLVMLLFTVLLYYAGNQWLIPALVSYAAFGGMLVYGNRLVRLVPYDRQ